MKSPPLDFDGLARIAKGKSSRRVLEVVEESRVRYNLIEFRWPVISVEPHSRLFRQSRPACLALRMRGR
jgi:hypothetical protein